MIRINLINDVSAMVAKQKKSGKGFRFDFNIRSKISSQAASIVADENKSFLARVVVLLFPILLTFAYDRYARWVSDEDLKRLNQEYTALQTKLQAQELAVKQVEKFQEEKAKLDSEL